MTDDAPKAAPECLWCGGPHDIYQCDRVKAFELDDEMNITRVEFLTPADYGPMPRSPVVAEEEPTTTYPKRKSLSS